MDITIFPLNTTTNDLSIGPEVCYEYSCDPCD